MRLIPPLLILSLTCCLPPLSIDMGLPAMQALQSQLGGSARDQELVLSVFMAGFALTPLVYGALADRAGRKPALYLGMILFTLASALCTLAPSMGLLLLARFFQGSGAGAGITLSFAIARDLYEGAKLGSRLSLIAMIVNTAPMIAPSLGALLLEITGWRGIYATLTVLGAMVLLLVTFGLPETRDNHPRPPGGGFQLGVAFKALRNHPSALGYIGVYGVSFASTFAYIASSSLLMLGYFKVTPFQFALLFAMTATGIVSGAFVCGKLGARVAGRHLVQAGLALTLLAPMAILALFVWHAASLPAVMAALVLATFGNGLLNPAATRAALSHFPSLSGIIGALLASVQMTCCALSSGLAATLLDRWGVIAVPVVMILFALAACSIFVLGTREHV